MLEPCSKSQYAVHGPSGLGVDAGDDGKFEFEFLSPGAYQLRFSRPGRRDLGEYIHYPGKIEVGKGEHLKDTTFIVPVQAGSSSK